MTTVNYIINQSLVIIRLLLIFITITEPVSLIRIVRSNEKSRHETPVKILYRPVIYVNKYRIVFSSEHKLIFSVCEMSTYEFHAEQKLTNRWKINFVS